MNRDRLVNGLDVDPFTAAVVGVGGVAADASARSAPVATEPAALPAASRLPAAAAMRRQVVRARVARHVGQRDHIAVAQRVEAQRHALRHRVVDRVFANNTNWLR